MRYDEGENPNHLVRISSSKRFIGSNAMVQMPNRPKRGLDLLAAFQKWSDPGQFAKLVSISGEAEPPSEGQADKYVRDKQSLATFKALRMEVDQTFIAKLSDAELIGSGMPSDGSGRVPVDPSLWDILELDYEFLEANGPHQAFTNLEFFEPSTLPMNIRHIPKWLDDLLGTVGQSVFRHSEDYRHIVLHGVTYALSGLWPDIVRILHIASIENGDGWRNGKQVLHEAGSAQLKLSDVIKDRKDGKSIIESDGRGMYRLALTPPSDPNADGE